MLVALHHDAPDGLAVFDAEWRYVYLNANAARVGGLNPHETIGRALDATTPGVWETAFGRALQSARADGLAVELTAHRGPSGRAYDAHISRVGAYVAVRFRDVTARVASDDALRESEARYRTLIETAPDTIALHRDGRLLYVNSAGLHLLGVANAADVLGRPVWDVIAPGMREIAEQRVAALAAGESLDTTAEYVLQRRDGQSRLVEASSGQVTFDGAPAIRTVLRDVSDRRDLEVRLRHQAEHDPLTGLANRALFRTRVEHALARLERSAPRDTDRAAGDVAVLFIDLDDFKQVNDALGHAAGDALLVQVAERLLAATRGRDTVARFGGDEFAVLLEHLESPDDAGTVVSRVLEALDRAVPLHGRVVALAASVGVAHARAGENADEVMRNADLAMYRAKSGGKRRAAVYEPAMHRTVVERLDLASDLTRAAERDEFSVVYQPVIDLRSGRVVGVEALVRWQHPQRGTLAPSAFIPLAEETGSIGAIGQRVLALACAQLAVWRACAPPDLVPWLSVNVSGRQLETDTFFDDVAAVLRETQISPDQLTLEVTESTLMRRTAETAARAHALRALGVRLGIDDFGTGYSSLAQLQRLPIDVLKLDKSFVDGVATNAGDTEIARAILALGGALGLRTVAEGIETPAQYARLRELGCAFGQGFLFAPPVEAELLAELLWGADALPVFTARTSE